MQLAIYVMSLLVFFGIFFLLLFSFGLSAKRKSCQTTILYLMKMSFKNEGNLKTFPNN